MRNHLILLLLVGLCTPSLAQLPDSIRANPKDVESPDAILGALYAVISGPAGQRRDWNRMRSLFLPHARLVATGKKPDGSAAIRVMSVEDYVTNVGPRIEKDGFVEQEIARRTERYGAVLHAFSSYAARRAATDPTPFVRGINSIQLYHDGQRWWINSILWQSETPELPIPTQYLPGK